jgi:hypothetical protein
MTRQGDSRTARWHLPGTDNHQHQHQEEQEEQEGERDTPTRQPRRRHHHGRNRDPPHADAARSNTNTRCDMHCASTAMMSMAAVVHVAVRCLCLCPWEGRANAPFAYFYVDTSPSGHSPVSARPRRPRLDPRHQQQQQHHHHHHTGMRLPTLPDAMSALPRLPCPAAHPLRSPGSCVLRPASRSTCLQYASPVLDGFDAGARPLR